MESKEISIKECVSEALDLYKNNFFLVLVTTAIAMIGSGITIGILAGPLLVGLFLIFLKQSLFLLKTHRLSFVLILKKLRFRPRSILNFHFRHLPL